MFWNKKNKNETDTIKQTPEEELYNKYEMEINNIIKESYFDIIGLSIGIPCEKISIFSGYIRLCGVGLSLKTQLGCIEEETYKEIRKLQSELYELYRKNKEGENNLNEIKETVYKQRKLALELGTITFAYKSQALNDNSAKSYYGNYEEKYAPYILLLYSNKENLLTSHLDRCLEAEFDSKEVFYPIDVYLANAIKDEDVCKLYDVIYKIVNKYNDYVSEEYKLRKNDEKYQHRHDYDPDSF